MDVYGNIEEVSRSGGKNLRVVNDIIAESTSGGFGLVTASGISLLSNGGVFTARGVSEAILQATNGPATIKGTDAINLFGQRIVLQNSRYIYGTADPDELETWTNIQEGTIYFKLLD